MPSLILRPKSQEGVDLAESPEAADDFVRVPMYLDLALHAVPGTVLLVDCFLFERKYPKKHARYGGALVAIIAGAWYAWWVEHCAAHNGICTSRLF